MAELRTIPERTTLIKTPQFSSWGAPVKGARAVFFKIGGEWIHKGWLMPDLTKGVYCE